MVEMYVGRGEFGGEGVNEGDVGGGKRDTGGHSAAVGVGVDLEVFGSEGIGGGVGVAEEAVAVGFRLLGAGALAALRFRVW